MFNLFSCDMMVNNSPIEHLPLKYSVHFAEWFPAHAKGYREGEHKLLCLENIVVVCMCGNIFLILESI